MIEEEEMLNTANEGEYPFDSKDVEELEEEIRLTREVIDNHDESLKVNRK